MVEENKVKSFVPLCLRSKGFTLIEMVIVVAIIAILVSIVVGVAKRISDQSKENLCRTTITIIGNALEQYRDFSFEYRNIAYAGLSFSLDCNGFSDNDLAETIRLSLNLPANSVTIEAVDPTKPIIHQPEYSGSEALYFFLHQIPDCRKTLDRIDKSLLTNKDEAGNEMQLVVSGVSYPLMRFIDPWEKGTSSGTSLKYDYYDKIAPPSFPYPNLDTKKTFPVIASAGPDGLFGTADDISNMKPK